MPSSLQSPSKTRRSHETNPHSAPLIFPKKHYIDPDELIFVSKPYNRLQRIERTSADSLQCIVVNEYTGDCEGGSIGTAEVGRHIAILGSIQLALEYNFGEKCFFLAIGAKLKQLSDNLKAAPHGTNQSRKFHLTVKTITADRKHATIAGKVYDEDYNELFAAEINYMITKKKVFERLFSDHRISGFPGNFVSSSPYDMSRKELSQICFSNITASGIHELVEPSECLGHFPEYPALPVAVIGNHFIQIGIKLFRHFYNYNYSSIVALDSVLEARRLVFPGETIMFSARIKNFLPDGILSVDCDAAVDGEVVATASILFQALS